MSTPLFEDPEIEALLAALAYFAPSYDVTVQAFAVAHQRAAALLAERQSSLSPNDIHGWVAKWPSI